MMLAFPLPAAQGRFGVTAGEDSARPLCAAGMPGEGRKGESVQEEQDMYYSVIKHFDIANGPGCRTVLFVSGCRNHCEGCFQPETWNFTYGQPFDEAVRQEILDSMEPAYVQGLTLLGGDPFEPENQGEVLELLRALRARYGRERDVWAYTGYLLDQDLIPGGRRYTDSTDELLSLIDILVDGPFVQEKKNIRLLFRGSENQRLIDLNASRAAGQIVTLGEDGKPAQG